VAITATIIVLLLILFLFFLNRLSNSPNSGGALNGIFKKPWQINRLIRICGKWFNYARMSFEKLVSKYRPFNWRIRAPYRKFESRD